MSKSSKSVGRGVRAAMPVAIRISCLTCGLAVGVLGAGCGSEGPASPAVAVVPQVAPTPVPLVVPAEKPDLIISNLNFSPAEPFVNQEITFWVDVKNQGPGPASASTLVFRVGGETFPPETAVPSLAVGETFRLERKVRLDVVQGYMVTATADAKAQVAETDETNNVTVRTFQVKP